MRCLFCGWDNPQGRTKCEKCNEPLQAGTVEASPSNVHERPTTRRQGNGGVLGKETVRESKSGIPGAVPEEKNVCPDCGYTLENGSCPSCGYKKPDPSVSGASSAATEGRKTVRPIRKEKEVAFILTPISEKTGEPEGDVLSFKGNELSLNRENTAPKNDTITSSEQAVVSHKEGCWFIEDRSEYKTTFVQAARKIELQDGDLILLGNQLYRFESSK